MGSRSVTLREDCCDFSLVGVNPLLLLEDKLLLLLLFSLLLGCCGKLLAGCSCWSAGRWATAVSIEVLAKRRASRRT